MEKIVQVSVSGCSNNAKTQSDAVAVALTDKGRVLASWCGSTWRPWEELPTLPQGESQEQLRVAVEALENVRADMLLLVASGN